MVPRVRQEAPWFGRIQRDKQNKETIFRHRYMTYTKTWTWICSRDEFQIALKFISSYSTFILFSSTCNASSASAIPAKT